MEDVLNDMECIDEDNLPPGNALDPNIPPSAWQFGNVDDLLVANLIHEFKQRSSDDLNGISFTSANGSGKRDSIEVTRLMPKFAVDNSLLIDLSI
jgi:hypothetical protein